MVALSASRLVCEAITWIRSTTTLMRLAFSARPCMVASVWPASSTALRAISADVITWRPIFVGSAQILRTKSKKGRREAGLSEASLNPLRISTSRLPGRPS
jgi:hypothetical protein